MILAQIPFPDIIIPTLIPFFRRLFGGRRKPPKPPLPIFDPRGLSPEQQAALLLAANRLRAAQGLAPLSALPIPATPVPAGPAVTPRAPPGRPPFIGRVITGPAANDPIFRSGKFGIGGRLLGVGGLIIIAAEILAEVAKRKQFKELGDILDDQSKRIASDQIRRARIEKDLQDAARRAAARIILPGRPEILPPVFPAPRRAPPVRTIPPPVVPPGLPRSPAPLPQPIGVPSIPSPTLPGTSPRAPTVPRPTTAPFPLPGIPGLPIPSPLGVPVPITLPLPFSFPSPAPVPLTPISVPGVPSPLPGPGSQFVPTPGSIVSPFTEPRPLQQTQPEQKCREVKRRRRRKGKCREGFFKEFPGRTRFITWRETDCELRGLI